jgi:outer membrane cobalamin receptor
MAIEGGKAVRRLLLLASAILCLPSRTQAQALDASPPDGGAGDWRDAAETEDSAAADVVSTGAGPGDAPPAYQAAPPEPSPASDVVVTAGRPLAKDRTQDATLIPGERVRASSRTNLFDVLAQEAADVYVPGHGIGLHGVANGATGGIRVRGLGGSPNTQVLVVEDGVPDYQGIFGHPIPDAYVPHLIEDVLVVKGGDSTLYGTNAMGGVVVMRSRWREEDGYEVQDDTGYGSYATLRECLPSAARVRGTAPRPSPA